MAIGSPTPVSPRFRRMDRESDLPLLHRWLRDPRVVRWWEGEDVSWPAVWRDYGPTSDDNVEHWIATLDGTDIGWIQCYAVSDYARYEETAAWLRAGVPWTTAGIDYLVGESSLRGRGIGTAMIEGFVEHVVFGQHLEWTHAAASPVTANLASWRALDRAGFRTWATLPFPDGPCRLMVRPRALRVIEPAQGPAA